MWGCSLLAGMLFISNSSSCGFLNVLFESTFYVVLSVLFWYMAAVWLDRTLLIHVVCEDSEGFLCLAVRFPLTLNQSQCLTARGYLCHRVFRLRPACCFCMIVCWSGSYVTPDTDEPCSHPWRPSLTLLSGKCWSGSISDELLFALSMFWTFRGIFTLY